jgi:hypothetical protein
LLFSIVSDLKIECSLLKCASMFDVELLYL